MPYTVELYQDDKLADNRKYRSGFPQTAFWTGEVVDIGNFAHLNVYADNSIELGCGNSSFSAISNAQLATHIKIIDKDISSPVEVLGAIVNWEYINDNNVRISYIVDAFMSAQLSGLITKAEGVCERVNMDTGEAYFANDFSEPFTPSDLTYADPDVTSEFNFGVGDFEGVNVGDSGVSAGGVAFILTVSPTLAEFCGVTTPFGTPSTPTPELKDISDFRFVGAELYEHSGGTYRGMPLKFSSVAEVKSFVNAILKGCGFRTTNPSNGFSTMESVEKRALAIVGNHQGAQQFYTPKNWNNDEYESIRLISGDDIYNLYAIPEAFASSQANYFTSTIKVGNFPDLDKGFTFGSELDFAGKLLKYPYIYYKLVTANGDTVQIIPQVHYEKSAAHTPTFFVTMQLRYIGGDMPRIMGRIVPAFSDAMGNGQDPYQDESCCEWFTIRSYPALSLSFNSTYNAQMQRDVSSFKKIAQSYANSVAMTRITNPMRGGYLDSVKHAGRAGVGLTGSNNSGVYGNAMYAAGAMLGNAQRFYGIGDGRSLVDDINKQEFQNNYALDSIGNFLSPDVGSVMGNDFITQFGIPAIACYWCGATDAELFAYARYLEEFGSACNGRVNPIDDSHDILGGTANIIKFNNETFYKFLNIRIDGYLPIEWKRNIKDLFENGVYLIG